MNQKKLRKRRCDAQYETPAQRQKAYRARLKERRRVDIHLQAPANVKDSSTPIAAELHALSICNQILLRPIGMHLMGYGYEGKLHLVEDGAHASYNKGSLGSPKRCGYGKVGITSLKA